MAKDIQGRKWQITINNPLEKGIDHEAIKTELFKIAPIIYWCMADEIGTEGQTQHTHAYIACSSPIRFSTLKGHFGEAHLERANGTSSENRDYIAKTGKWEGTEKSETAVPGSFEEWGEMPDDRKPYAGVEADILIMIHDGATNAEILSEYPQYLRGIRDVEHARQTMLAEEYRGKWREVETAYIWGKTGAGKTRHVMKGNGYANVYAVNSYKHPFDGYAGESVMLFDEFDGSIRIQDMNCYLDGYPLSLPARYTNKQACYDRVYIVSNLDLRMQYKSVQIEKPDVWMAFLRRIGKVIRFMPDGSHVEHETQDYMEGIGVIEDFPDGMETPWG